MPISPHFKQIESRLERIMQFARRNKLPLVPLALTPTERAVLERRRKIEELRHYTLFLLSHMPVNDLIESWVKETDDLAALQKFEEDVMAGKDPNGLVSILDLDTDADTA